MTHFRGRRFILWPSTLLDFRLKNFNKKGSHAINLSISSRWWDNVRGRSQETNRKIIYQGDLCVCVCVDHNHVTMPVPDNSQPYRRTCTPFVLLRHNNGHSLSLLQFLHSSCLHFSLWFIGGCDRETERKRVRSGDKELSRWCARICRHLSGQRFRRECEIEKRLAARCIAGILMRKIKFPSPD